MKPSFLKNFPYASARDIQVDALKTLEDKWEEYDVFCIVAPTATGKTALARTLMNALRSVSVITPTNLLVNQFLQEFPDTPTLSRMDSYFCEEWQRPCPQTRNKLLKFCKPKVGPDGVTVPGCKCGKDLATAKYQRGPGIYNYYTYMAHKLYRDVLVVDEAHNLLSVIRDRMALKLWQHDLKYPLQMWRPEQVMNWIEGLSEQKRRTKKIQALQESVRFKVPNYIFQRTKDWFNGKGTLRNEPEERDLIKLLPVDITQAPPMFWPREVKKIILMSATIGPKDIEQLGLGGRKVAYIQCKSPIPWGSRPIIPLDILSVNRQSMQDNISTIAEYIQKVTDHHIGEKGVIHVTYQLASLLREHLSDPRFIFHSRDTKNDSYRAFRESGKDSVLIACGMYEGIDLPDELGRWQLIAKIPWQSLGSPAIKHLADLDPEWYIWETLKITIQACGRVCRTPEDFGVTYVLDKSFGRLIKDGIDMCPEWFLDAIDSDYMNNLFKK